MTDPQQLCNRIKFCWNKTSFHLLAHHVAIFNILHKQNYPQNMYDICACLTLAHQLATDKEELVSHLVGLKNKNYHVKIQSMISSFLSITKNFKYRTLSNIESLTF